MLIVRQLGSFDVPGDWEPKSEVLEESSFTYLERESLVEMSGVFALYIGDDSLDARNQKIRDHLNEWYTHRKSTKPEPAFGQLKLGASSNVLFGILEWSSSDDSGIGIHAIADSTVFTGGFVSHANERNRALL